MTKKELIAFLVETLRKIKAESNEEHTRITANAAIKKAERES